LIANCDSVAFIPVDWRTTGFAPEGLRDEERVYETTTSGRARDAKQELH